MSATLLDDLFQFLRASPTPYHAVASVRAQLLALGYQQLDEADAWQLHAGGNYFVTRRDASILAFRYGTEPLPHTGLRIIGAHTDSPCLKIKPRPERLSQGYGQLGVEVYGGVLLNPWFDRDLSIAGRVAVKNRAGQLQHCLVNFERPIACVPSLAIHLDRGANEQRSVNPQEDMRPVLLQSEGFDFRAQLLAQLTQQGYTELDQILEYDLCLYDTQPPAQLGLKGEFIASARLDNLLSCFVGLQAFVNATGSASSLLLLTDHEEVGSQSDIGAKSNFLNAFLDRLFANPALRHQALANSLMVSVDNAHGIHPNYPRKHDESHGPKLNAGPVLKVDANQGYATSSESASFLQLLAADAGVSLQAFVTRADMRCGSTIGPMTAAQSGIRTVDIGLPTFAMHSIRELAGAEDPQALLRLLLAFLDCRSLRS
jgi:aspartyl aminopeptidase